MNFINTKDHNEKVSFKEATLTGLAANKGLYVPETIPLMLNSFFESIEQLENVELAFQVMFPYVKDSLAEEQLRQILKETLSFPIPVVEVSKHVYALELFHGPTQAFKDVGARFMSRCLSQFMSQQNGITVLVATSGDTGSAVAHGFYNVKGVTVKILFPKGKISLFQEYQMTSLGNNIHAIEVDGTFDDCQSLVKQAFSDRNLNRKLQLSSANSINVARVLPQMLYYFFAYKQLKSRINNKRWIVSVPSGNFGNLTAGLLARNMGLPIHKFVAANNANDTFYQYWQTGEYIPKPSVVTCSNAMDVGVPSNFERIMHLYESNYEAIKNDILASSFSDKATLKEIQETYQKTDYILDPHGAVGLLALKQYLDDNSLGVFLETAHPRKFEAVVKKAIPTYPIQEVSLNNCSKVTIDNSYDCLLQELKRTSTMN